MALQEINNGPQKVKKAIPIWVWGVGVVLVVLLAVAGVQLVNAWEKIEEVTRSLEAAHESESKAAEAKIAEAVRQLARVKILLTRTQSELDATRAAKAAADNKTGQLAGEVAALKGLLETAKTDLDTATSAGRDTQAELGKLRTDAEKLKAALDEMAAKLESAQADADAQRKRVKQLENSPSPTW